MRAEIQFSIDFSDPKPPSVQITVVRIFLSSKSYFQDYAILKADLILLKDI